MEFDVKETLARLRRELVRSGGPRLPDDARLVRRDGRSVLRIGSAFLKSRLESRFAPLLESACAGPVEVEFDAGARVSPAPPAARVGPNLRDPANAGTLRLVQAFCDGSAAAVPLLVVHAPPASGKSVLLEWAAGLASDRVFRIDVARLRSGRSRGLVPRKPLAIADGIEGLVGAATGQRTLCGILDAMRDRGDRVLTSVAGHPAQAGFEPALLNRLLGGVLVSLAPPGRAEVRDQLRRRARSLSRPLPREWEEELAQLPARDALAALDERLLGGASAAPRAILERLRDCAARIFGVERALLDGASKRRRVVDARRAIMAAAIGSGLDEAETARAFGLASRRPVREACRWAKREAARDPRFANCLRELGRVLPGK